MKKTFPRWDLPIHPIFWGLYPLASLYLANIAEVPLRAVAPSLAFASAVTISVPFIVLIFLTFGSVGRKKRAIWLMACEIVFFIALYFLLYRIVKDVSIHDTLIGRHRYLLPVWSALCFTALIYTLTPSALLSDIKKRSTWEDTALVSSLLLILFFSYGHIFNIIVADKADASNFLGLHKTLLALWGLILAISLWLLWKAKNKTKITQTANVVGGLLLLITLIQIGIWALQSASKPKDIDFAQTPSPADVPVASDSPDIYYIVLDGYGRSDYLLDNFQIDNSEFIAGLKSMGFIIPDCTQSNYHLTILSMTSSLNMDYLTAFPPGRQENAAYLDFEPYLQNNRVLGFFENLGYETFTFSGINPYTEIPNSTHFITSDGGAGNSEHIAALNFQFLFLQTTALRPLLDYRDSLAERQTVSIPLLDRLTPSNMDLLNRRYFRYQQNKYHLEVLEGIPELPGKKFVYAHLYMAHEPFVFTAEGEFRSASAQDKAAYKDQIVFLNSRIPAILQKIIAQSSVPPIIIVQADHGWGWNKRRDEILNAYYLPNGGDQLIYPNITPVNTFRLVINKYFEGNYDLLPDVSYYAPHGDFQTKNLSAVQTTCASK